MTKEQEAIEYLKESVLIYKNAIPKISESIGTVLSMLKEKDKEIDCLKKAGKATEDVYKREIEKKDKIIDLMAKSFAEEGFYSEHCQTLIDNEICPNDCDKCVKQYFERKVKRWKLK